MLNSRLKLWIHVVVGLACAIGSLACAMAALHRAEEVKRFRADEEIKNLGTLKQQDERDVTFRLINSAEAPVEIIRVNTSCTCTRAEPAARNLQPGESTELTAHLNVGTLRGKVAARLDVLYRDRDGQDLKRLPLTITASVDPHYAVTPEDVVFEVGRAALERNLRHDATITITPNGGAEIRVLGAHSTHPAVKIEKISPDTVTGSTTIHLIFDPTRCIAPSVQAQIVVHTDSKLEPIHRVPVRVVSKDVH